MTGEGESDEARYRRDIAWLTGAIHELPAGVLWGADAASPEQCADMMEGLAEFERLCVRLGLSDHSEFIEGCRWHLEHYPHYVGRRRHFIDYATYVHDRHGPLRVAPPPPPPWLR
jgi:hypothetical protein